jgi:hypothetical protein
VLKLCHTHTSFEWHKWFMEGWVEVEDRECPSTSKTKVIFEKISEIIRKD